MNELYNKAYMTEYMMGENGEGIIYGCEFTQKNAQIILEPGIIKFAGEIYSLEKSINISDLIEEKNFSSGYHCNLVIKKDAQMPFGHGAILDITYNPDKNCMILAQFQSGLDLRPLRNNAISPQQEIENQLKTKSSTFSVINAKGSLRGESTFHPFIFSLIRETLEKKSSRTYADYQLLHMLYQNRLLSKNNIRLYIEQQTQEYPSADDNVELMKKFLKAVEVVGKNQTFSSAPVEQKSSSPSRMR